MNFVLRNQSRGLHRAVRTLAISIVAAAGLMTFPRVQAGSFDTWSLENSGTTAHLFGVAYGNGIFVATGTNGTIITSPDGSVWTPRNSGTTNYLNGVAFGSGTFVAVGGSGTILTSSDGVNWTPQSSGFGSSFHAVAHAGGLFLAVGYAGTIVTSSNAVDWTSRSSGLLNSLHSIGYANGTFVVAGFHGGLATSPDAVTWTPRNSGVGTTLYAITYGNGAFLAMGTGGAMIASPDGVAWSGRTSGTINSLHGAAYVDGTFVVAGFRGTILTSSNGVAWAKPNSGTTNSLRAVTVGSNGVVVVGHRGTVLRQRGSAPSPVSITAQPISLVVTQGRAARFSVTASGVAPLRYQWFFNGSSIPRATRPIYMLRRALGTNAGDYFVVVTNVHGAATSAVATLTVRIPPSITSKPASLIVTQGNSATFQVAAAGDAPLSYQWRFKNVEIPGAVSDTYVVADVQLTNAGAYTVRITNPVGAVTSRPARLKVIKPRQAAVSAMSAPERELQLYHHLVVTNGAAVLRISLPPGVPSTIESSPDLIHWTPVFTNASGAELFFGEPATAASRFFRGKRWP